MTVTAWRKGGKAHRPYESTPGGRPWRNGDSRSVHCGHVCRMITHRRLEEVSEGDRCRICWPPTTQ